MYSIKVATVESIVQAARNVYPNEFIALLGSKQKNKVVDELVILPATYGETFSSIRMHLLPFDKSVLGSVHSHPGYSAKPSRGDLAFFKRLGKLHLIICAPFTFEAIKAYNRNGEEIEIEIVE